MVYDYRTSSVRIDTQGNLNVLSNREKIIPGLAIKTFNHANEFQEIILVRDSKENGKKVFPKLIKREGEKVPDLIGDDLATSIDQNGNILAIYQPSRTFGENARWLQASPIEARLFMSGKGWGDPVKIGLDGSIDQGHIIVKFDSKGNALALWWAQLPNQKMHIYANRYEKDEGWGKTAQIDNSLTNAGGPSVSFDSEGNAAAIWMQFDEIHQGGHYLSSNRYERGKGWGKPEEVTSNHGLWPRITLDDQGNAVAIWQPDLLP